MNFRVNDTVLYGSDGVCLITEIATRQIGTQALEYYILKPIYDEKSTIFVPKSNEMLMGKMKKLPTEKEILFDIEAAKDTILPWIDDDNARKVRFREIIGSGKLAEILCMMKLIILHRDEQNSCGKKLHLADERLLKDAEKIAYDEIAFVLNIPRTSVQGFLKENFNI